MLEDTVLDAGKVVTEGDKYVRELFSQKDTRDYGCDLKQILQGCNRTVAFSNLNVVATVSFLTTIGMYMLKINQSGPFYDIKSQVQGFATGRIDWAEFVRIYWDMQKKLNLSDVFADEVITRIEYKSYAIMNYVDRLPLDVGGARRPMMHWGPPYE